MIYRIVIVIKMSFLSELKKQKQKLKQTETVVTSLDGQRYIEGGSGASGEVLLPNRYGFIVDTKPDDVPALIVDHLYLGSQDCALANVLNKYDIKHVLSLGVDVEVNFNKMFIDCLDLPETNVKKLLVEALPFVHEGVERGENVLVHCNAGVSRSATVVIGYLMQYKGMYYQDAYQLVKERRPAAQPNTGFKKQLETMKPSQIL